MKTTLATAALLALLFLACHKDDDTSATGATPEAVGMSEADRRPDTGQGTTVVAPEVEVPASDTTDSSVVLTPQVAGTRLEIENVSGTVGRNATADITMYEATEGLAGFKINVSVADPGVARIVGVDLSDFGLRDTGPLPATVLWIIAADLSRAFEGAFDRETIATLDLELLTAGETEIVLQVLRLDDDNGDAVFAQVVHGQLSVADTGSRP